MNEKISDEGYFRPKSPWLPGTRKVSVDDLQPVELKSISKVQNGDMKEETSFVRVTDLLASWASDETKMVLQGINFKLDHVSCVISRTLSCEYNRSGFSLHFMKLVQTCLKF